MSTVLETDAAGGLRLPPELLPHATPFHRYLVETEAEWVVVREADGAKAFWQTATAEERAVDILRWAASPREGRGLPDSALARDTIYD